MPLVGYEATTTMFERAKIDHASDRAATMIGLYKIDSLKIF
jgi:hypothetical protein